MSSAADATEIYRPFVIDDTYYTINLDRVRCIRPILTYFDTFCYFVTLFCYFVFTLMSFIFCVVFLEILLIIVFAYVVTYPVNFCLIVFVVYLLYVLILHTIRIRTSNRFS